MPDVAPTPPTAGATPDRTLAAAGFATALALVAFTLPLGLMPSIGPDLGASVAGRTWILSSMSVGLAASLLVAGSIADDLGRRRIFLAGLITFAFGSFAGAAAQSVLILSVARAIQGVGSAALLATALALIAHAVPAGPARAHATSVWGAMIGLGIAVGPIAGVVVAEVGGWRSAYLVLGLVALLAFSPSSDALTESRAETPRPLDLPGAGLLALGLFAITAGIVEGNAAGWDSPLVAVCLIGGTAVLAAFAWFELQIEQPLFDVTLLRNAPFTAALASSFVLGLTVLAFMSYEMTFTQSTLHTSPVAASLWGATWAIVTFLVALKGRALAGRISSRVQISSGLLLCGLGLVTMLGIHAGDSAARLVPGFLIMGVGTGFLNAALGQAAVATVPPERAGMGAGANNTARYLGAALGVALVVGTLHAGTQSRVERALGDVLEPSIAVPLARQIASGEPRTAASGFAPDAQHLVGRLADSAGAQSMNTVIRTTALITFAGALLCFTLMRPRQRVSPRGDEPARDAPAAGPGPASPPVPDRVADAADTGDDPRDGPPSDSLWLRPR